MLAAVFCVSSLRDIVLAFSPSFRRGWGPLVVGDAAGARSAPRTGPGAWGPWSNKKQRSEADVSRLSGGTHPHSVKGWVTQRAMTGEGSETRSGVCERSRQGLCWRSARSPVFWSPRRRLPNRERSGGALGCRRPEARPGGLSGKNCSTETRYVWHLAHVSAGSVVMPQGGGDPVHCPERPRLRSHAGGGGGKLRGLLARSLLTHLKPCARARSDHLTKCSHGPW